MDTGVLCFCDSNFLFFSADDLLIFRFFASCLNILILDIVFGHLNSFSDHFINHSIVAMIRVQASTAFTRASILQFSRKTIVGTFMKNKALIFFTVVKWAIIVASLATLNAMCDLFGCHTSSNRFMFSSPVLKFFIQFHSSFEGFKN